MGGINNSQLNELKNGVLKGDVLGVKQEEKELVYDEVIRELIKRLDLRNSTDIPSHILGITQSDIDRWNNDEKGIISESDPTIASFLKSITQEDIDRWNNVKEEKVQITEDTAFAQIGDTQKDFNKNVSDYKIHADLRNNEQDDRLSDIENKNIDQDDLINSLQADLDNKQDRTIS